ncbi:MAG: acyl carrier protein [Ilumatobacteraceae bacterium]
MTDTERTIRSVLAQHGRVNGDANAIGIEVSLYAAGLTSHASVNVMLALEDEFDVEFPEHLLRRSTFESIATLLDAIDSISDSDST